MTTPAEQTYTDPTALSLDGACGATGIPYDHEAPWAWAHRWRPVEDAKEKHE